MKRSGWKVIGVLGLLAGLLLVSLEVAQLATGSDGESWFWLVIGLLLVAFGVAEVAMRRPPVNRDDDLPLGR